MLADLNDGLVAHYPFDGNANDNSGNGLNGQIHGNAVFTTDRHGDTDNAFIKRGLSPICFFHRKKYYCLCHNDRGIQSLN